MENKKYESFGEFLYQERIKSGLTLREYCNKYNLSPVEVSHIENGDFELKSPVKTRPTGEEETVETMGVRHLLTDFLRELSVLDKKEMTGGEKLFKRDEIRCIYANKINDLYREQLSLAREEERLKCANEQLAEIEVSRNEERKRTVREVIKLLDVRRTKGLSEMFVVDQIKKMLDSLSNQSKDENK